MAVYVRWYGRVLEGELLEGEHLGMKQVRIPLDGHHPVALFAPGHVYETVEEMQEIVKEVYKYPKEFPTVAKLSETYPTIPGNQRNVATINGESVDLDDEALLGWIRFKYEHWDYEHNHLQTDALDDFYKIWRDQHSATIVPYEHCLKHGYPNSLKVEAPVTLPSHQPEVTPAKAVPKSGTPKARQKSHKPEKEAVQLSLFN